jgi:hypothetical protein
VIFLLLESWVIRFVYVNIPHFAIGNPKPDSLESLYRVPANGPPHLWCQWLRPTPAEMASFLAGPNTSLPQRAITPITCGDAVVSERSSAGA